MRCPVLVSALTCDPSSGSGSAVDPESETVCDPASVTSCGHETATATGGIGDPSCGPARTSVACPCRSSDPPLTPSSATPRRQPQKHLRRLVPPAPAGSPPQPWSPARALARPNKELRAGLVTREANGPRISKPTPSKSYFRQKCPDFCEPIYASAALCRPLWTQPPRGVRRGELRVGIESVRCRGRDIRVACKVCKVLW